MAEGGNTEDIEEEVNPFDSSSSYQDGVNNTTSEYSSEVENVCSFFLKGICLFGDKCWFIHPAIRENMNSASESRKRELFAELSPEKIENSGSQTITLDDGIMNNLRSFNANHSAEPIPCGPDTPNWVSAPEFVTNATSSYSAALKPNDAAIESETQSYGFEYCTYYDRGVCRNNNCLYMHGDWCELCQKWCLDPIYETKRKLHIEQCKKELEQNMEYSFSVQRSQDKMCGICLDIIMEKPNHSERNFGILENCNHVYCLDCIKKWRRAERDIFSEYVMPQLSPIVTHSCPECRVISDIIIPSPYFPDSESVKKRLISEYKLAQSIKHCRYIKQGLGTCPFGDACFYLHAYLDISM